MKVGGGQFLVHICVNVDMHVVMHIHMLVYLESGRRRLTGRPQHGGPFKDPSLYPPSAPQRV